MLASFQAFSSALIIFSSSGMLPRSSGQPVGPVLSRNVGKYRTTPRNIPEESRSEAVCLSHIMPNGVFRIVPRLRTGQSWVRVPEETKDFYLLQTVQTGPGAHRSSYLKGIRGVFPGSEAVGARS